MITISILGTGKVAKHLCNGFTAVADVKVVQIIGRNTKALSAFGNGVHTSSDFLKIEDADIFVLAVKDDAIAEVSGYLEDKKGLVVHTSGSVSMDTLSNCGRYGVFYPLQTFSKNRTVDMATVPICWEARDQADGVLLQKLGGKISEKVHHVDSEQRRALHLAAVFVNNFTNHLYYIGQQICREKGLAFELLLPLIRETVDKLADLKPQDAQTGPARRGDAGTIEKHLQQLKNSEYKEVYKLLSESIGKLYGTMYT
ncbi:MAG TPA: Rossmann-like and DUF2520 domain-containing protein [Pricia sp.]|nr:Rossmann-like and DUF2520 domain-containing protein [Pricia sp.]